MPEHLTNPLISIGSAAPRETARSRSGGDREGFPTALQQAAASDQPPRSAAVDKSAASTSKPSATSGSHNGRNDQSAGRSANDNRVANADEDTTTDETQEVAAQSAVPPHTIEIVVAPPVEGDELVIDVVASPVEVDTQTVPPPAGVELDESSATLPPTDHLVADDRQQTGDAVSHPLDAVEDIAELAAADAAAADAANELQNADEQSQTTVAAPSIATGSGVVTPVVAGDAAAAELATESTDGITPATLDGASAEQKPTTRATTARRDSSGQTPIAPAATLGEGETPLGTDEANGVAADLADTASSGEQSQDGESAETSTKSPAAEQPTSTLAERAGRFMRNLNEASDKSPPKLSPADASRFVNRVSKAFEAAQHQDGIVRIRLSPPELGAMRIELSVQNGSLSARLETETSAARTVLLDNLPALRERLAEQQIRIDQFHVDVGGGQHDGAPDWQTAERDAQPRPGRAVQSAQQRETAQTHEAPQAPQIDSDGRFSAVA